MIKDLAAFAGEGGLFAMPWRLSRSAETLSGGSRKPTRLLHFPRGYGNRLHVGEYHSELGQQPGRVVLAHEQPFRLGVLEVHPATRQLITGGQSQTIEPRIMQVLVVLAQSSGQVITRDELVERCWNGRIVGDDAINRALSRIRQLASAGGEAAFRVETIPRVGYRLIRLDSLDTATSPHEPVHMFGRRSVVIGAAGLIAAAAGVYVSRFGSARSAVPQAARDLFERAYVLRFTGEAQDNRQAIAYLKDATRIAPNYGEAWGALALAYRSALDTQPPERTQGFKGLLDEAVRQAVRLDPGNADAAAARVDFKLLPRRWDVFETTARRLIAAHPGHPYGHELLGTVLMEVGRWRDAVGSLRSARARNAFAPIISYKLTIALWASGAIGVADAESDAALRRWPEHSAAWQTKLKLLMLTGRPGAAMDLAKNPAARPLNEPRDDVQSRDLILKALISQQRRDRDAAAGKLIAALRLQPENALPTALWCAALDEGEKALSLLEGLYLGIGSWSSLEAETSSNITHPLFQPPMHLLWSTSGYAKILDRIGLERYWSITNTVPDFRRG